MDFFDLLKQAGGEGSVDNLGSMLGLDSAQTGKMIAAVAPSLLEGLKGQTASADGSASLASALQKGDHSKYLDYPELIGAVESITDGNNILGHILGSKDTSRNVAASAAEASGVSADLIKKALPLLAGMAMGALSKGGTSEESEGSDLADMLGGLTDLGDVDAGDVLDFAKKLF